MSTTPPAPPESEAALLAREAAAAEAAVRAKLREAQTALRRAADVRAWTVRYPWPAVGAAAAAGLAVAFVAIPRKEESSGRGAADEQPGANGHSRRTRSRVWDSLLSSLLEVLKNVLQTAIVAGTAARATQGAAETAAESVVAARESNGIA